MFRRREDTRPIPAPSGGQPDRVTSVLGSGIIWKGRLTGSGGIRVEGAVDGDIDLRGLLVISESGRVTCEYIRANIVIVAGVVRGDITAEKVEIRSTGRVWGDVVAAAFATEEGAFLRGQIRMEESVDLGALPAEKQTAPVAAAETDQSESPALTPETSTGDEG